MTKTTTLQQYVNLYSGPAHAMHFKYATLMNTVYVTFMFGVALPILFPIAAFTFFNMYIVERVLLAYYYKLPPTYAGELNDWALAQAKWAPILLIFFGYWTLGQPSIFFNKITPTAFSFNEPTNGHTATPYLGPELPMFIAGLLFCSIMLLNIFGLFNKCMKRVGCMEK